MFENVDGRTDDGVTGILIAHLEAFGSGELKKSSENEKKALKMTPPPPPPPPPTLNLKKNSRKSTIQEILA